MEEYLNLKKEYLNLKEEKLIRECRRNPSQFCQYVLSWGINNWIPMSKMHFDWQETLSNKGKRVLILSPRDHSKTTFIPIGRCLWELGNNPNLRIKLVCQSDDIAIKRLLAITEHIERNPRFKQIFPDIAKASIGTWSKTKIYVERDTISTDPSIEAVGILSTATGGRADLIIMDDPVDFRNAIEQPSLRQTVKEVFYNVWINLLEPEGRLWVIGTIWHKDDLLNELLKDNTFYKVVYKIDNNFTPVWEQKWNKEALIKRRNEIGEKAFARAFKMEALSDEDIIFNSSILQKCEDKNLEYGKLPITNSPINIYMGVDLGSSRITKEANYTVIFTGAVINGKKIPLNITRGKFKSPEFAKILYDLIKLFNPNLIMIENNASQEAVIQWINEIYNDVYLPPIKGYFTGNQKMSEDIGLPSMAVEMEQGNWILPSFHSVGCNCNYCVWIKELKEFPIGKYFDTVMASWLFREAVRKSLNRMPKITSLMEDEENFDNLSEQELINNKIKILESLATIDDITLKLCEDEDD